MNLHLSDLDHTCNGSMRAFLDHISEHGVTPEQGRGFATWLEGLLDQHDRDYRELKDELVDLKRDFEEYCDENPEQVVEQDEPVVHAENLYLPNQAVANTRAARLAQDPRVRETMVQFEPDNGWLVVIWPNLADLRDLAGQAEIKDGVQRSPEGKVRVTSPDTAGGGRTSSAGGEGSGKAPSKGATKKVWDIADQVYGERGLDRAAIMAACEAAGVNKATAGTQYSKWRKTRGYQ